MPDYLCLLYSEDTGDAAERQARWDELPRWHVLTERMREAGVWVANNPLHGVESATTVRVRDGDGQRHRRAVRRRPRRSSAGYYLLDAARDLDEARRARGRADPGRATTASVEVRPVAATSSG